MSRFERELGDTALIVDNLGSGHVVNEPYACILGFVDAADMDDWCHARADLPYGGAWSGRP